MRLDLNHIKARTCRYLKTAFQFGQHRQRFASLGLGLITATLIIVPGSISLGQSATPSYLQTPKVAVAPSPASTPNSPSVATADVTLDGRTLFTIAAPNVSTQPGNQAPATPPIKQRVKGIEDTLKQVAESNVDPKTLDVKSVVDQTSRLPIVSIGDRYLMTVTTLDAQLQGQEPEQRANELTQTIKEALITARQERQPQSLIKQGSLAGQIALSMVVISSILVLVQRWLKAKRRQLAEQAATVSDTPTPDSTSTETMSIVQDQMDARRERNLNDMQRRLLQVLQLATWLGGIFAILGLFPYTRWLQSLVLSGPLKILGVVVITYLLIRVSDVLIDRFFNVLTTDELLSPDTSQRLGLRVTTFSRVLRSLVATALISMGVLTALSIVGVEIGPVLAGAGILGLAISFASQNLIKDFINGLLILWEDQYAVGDVIQIGKASGLVEYMNLRITQLRNLKDG